MPAMRFKSVVLPLPLGPMSARKVPASTSKSRPSSGRTVFSPRRYSRVSWRHSMSAMIASFVIVLVIVIVVSAAGAGVRRFADDADALAVAQTLLSDDERVADVQAGGDLHPA